MAYLRYCPGINLERLKTNDLKYNRRQSLIWKRYETYITDKSLECYCYSNLLGKKVRVKVILQKKMLLFLPQMHCILLQASPK